MSWAKHELDRLDGDRDTAIRIALEATAIEECEYHEGFYSDLDNPSAAYARANWLFNRDQLASFRTRAELNDAIREALAVPDHCVICAKVFGPQ